MFLLCRLVGWLIGLSARLLQKLQGRYKTKINESIGNKSKKNMLNFDAESDHYHYQIIVRKILRDASLAS